MEPAHIQKDIASYITRKENFDKIVIELKKKTSAEIIQNVKALLRDVYDISALPEKEQEISDLIRSTLDEKKGELAADLARYSEEPRYPGRKRIEPYLTMIKSEPIRLSSDRIS